MKKYIFIFIITFLCLTGCTKKLSNIPSDNHELKIEYSYIESIEIKYSKVYEIKLYSDGIMEYGYTDEEPKKLLLSNKAYDEIVSYAFGSKFQSLPNSVSDPGTYDGSSSYITTYSDKTFETGGLNVTNSIYNKLVKLLRNQIEGDKK